MRQEFRKGAALIFAVFMIATVFAAIPVKADTYSPTNAWDIAIANDPLGGVNLYPGEQNVAFDVRIGNGNAATQTDTANLQSCNLYIETGTVWDEAGNVVTSPIENWDVDAVEDGATINDGFAYTFAGFQFDIAPDAEPGIYNISVDLQFIDSDGTPSGTQHFTGYFTFEIMNNIVVADAQPDLYAGETFTDMNILVDFNWGSANDLYLNLSGMPTGITLDHSSGWIPGAVSTFGTNINYKVDVARDVAPGVYTIDYQIEYTNADGVRCTETGTLDITVEFTPVIEAEAVGTTTIMQGDASIPALAVRFSNTGNVDLRNIEIWPELDGVFFYSAVDFYEGADGSGVQNPQIVDKVELDSLAQGENTSQTWFVALDPYVQAGQHRILFDWSATFFDNGATDNPTHYVDVTGGWWDDDGDASTPMVPVCDVNPGTEWIAGAYVFVTVTDVNPDFTADKMENLDTWDDYFDLSWDNLVYVNIGTWINNFEMVPFTDLRATLQVNNTPFMNPLNHSALTVENDLWNSDDAVNADDSAWMEWFVDIDPNTAPGIYTVDIVLTGRNADTGEDISVTMQSVVEVRGFGPELIVTSVTTGDINPGQQFTMNLTITNQGDDTARNVFVWIPDSFIFGGDPSQYWNVIDGFVNSISTYRDDYENGAETETIRDNSNITLEQLNINDAKEIVDLNLYIEGVYTHPAPTVWMVKASNLAPGESVTVTFQMISNANMAPGRPYIIPIEVDFVDSNGDWDWWDNSVTVQSTGVAEPYHAASGSEFFTNDNALGWGFLGLIFVLVLLLAWMFGPRKKEEEPLYREEKPVIWNEPVAPTQQEEPAPTQVDYAPSAPPQEESIPEIAEMSVDEPAAVDASAEGGDEVPLVYDEKDNQPESF